MRNLSLAIAFGLCLSACTSDAGSVEDAAGAGDPGGGADASEPSGGAAEVLEPDGVAAPEPEPSTVVEGECTWDGVSDLEFLSRIGCQADFDALASDPLDASIPGARSVKTVLDRFDPGFTGDPSEDPFPAYFQNSKKYLIHWDFAHVFLSGQGKPPVPPLGQFNTTEYYSPDRRFLLGAVTYYEEPGVWVYEISPYDTATADMITAAYEVLKARTFFGPALLFHPTSQAVEKEALKLPPSVKQISTGELFAGVSYQPLNLGTSTGKLRFFDATTLSVEALDFRDIAVLDHVPNDIGVVSGIITAELQTPLSHINVLSQNRGTPNMALIGADEDPTLLALEGKWVELTVGPFAWSIHEITQEEAELWWEANKPEPVGVPELDLTVTELRDVEDLLDLDPKPSPESPPQKEATKAALAKSIPAYGGKASHYGLFPYMGEDVPHPKAFAIPVFYYRQHMEANGLDPLVEEMLADPEFQGSAKVRAEKLAALQDAVVAAPLDADFLDLVLEKLATDFPGERMRFRSSTNAEDLGGFTGAGLYTSKTGDPLDPKKPVDLAIKKVYAAIWNYKAYDERQYRSIPHLGVGMALLVHGSFPEEEANGVALTGNIFDTSGLEPGFYVNVQEGGDSVVLPEPGFTTDQFIYHFQLPGQPLIFLSHSNQVPPGETVLTNAETYALGKALDRIHKMWMPTYGPPPEDPFAWYAMDIEFKFDGAPGEAPTLFVKQARPHPGWGLK